MDEKQEYTLQLVAEDWKEVLTDKYNFCLERVEVWEKDFADANSSYKKETARGLRDYYRYSAEGIGMALDALGYTFDGEEIVLKWGDAYGKIDAAEES